MYVALGVPVAAAGTRALEVHESEPAPQSWRPPWLSNAAKSMCSFPEAPVDVTVPLQPNRSPRSFSTRLNFPFFIGIWKPSKLNSTLIELPVAGQRETWLMKNGSNFGPLEV